MVVLGLTTFLRQPSFLPVVEKYEAFLVSVVFSFSMISYLSLMFTVSFLKCLIFLPVVAYMILKLLVHLN